MIGSLTIRQEGGRVLILAGGVLIATIPWEKADEIARALIAKARLAETFEKAPAIAHDHAILLRSGARFGLSNHPRIQAAAANIAAWDRKLRRYMPGGVKSEEQVGIPTVIRHAPEMGRS